MKSIQNFSIEKSDPDKIQQYATACILDYIVAFCDNYIVPYINKIGHSTKVVHNGINIALNHYRMGVI